jgi:hypothetical protein
MQLLVGIAEELIFPTLRAVENDPLSWSLRKAFGNGGTITWINYSSAM